jgi:diketogulonate reductase-like aldo/keto reductase
MSGDSDVRRAQKSQYDDPGLWPATIETTRMLDRRQLLSSLAAAGAATALPRLASAQNTPLLTRKIPASGEQLPLVGLGSWRTFNVGDDPEGRNACAEVMRAFFAGGGRLIDSSPMYGSSQDTIGYGLNKLGARDKVFAADKAWTYSGGAAQVETSRKKWGVARFDLLQVHNLLSWQDHLPMLLDMKAQKRLRYVGITTSEGRRHEDFEHVMRSKPLDFIQVTYNALDRESDKRILPLARERGLAVIINRPFQSGPLIRRAKRHPLPAWAKEIDCANWAQVLLKFIVSHPAVTCAIPATTRTDHVRENIGASYGRLPDEALRKRIVAAVERF